jgi:hypothetical protein
MFIFHFNDVFKFKFKRNMLRQFRSFSVRNPGFVIIRRIFCLKTVNTCPQIAMTEAVRSKNRMNSDSPRNCQPIDEDSSGRKVTPPWNYQLKGRNPPEEWDSAGNYQVIGDLNTQKSFEWLEFQDQKL